MVIWWKDQREKAIKLTKFRITHHEKHGNGSVAMKEKQILEKQKKHHKRIEESEGRTYKP